MLGPDSRGANIVAHSHLVELVIRDVGAVPERVLTWQP
jgi:hypothetical protein